MGISGGKCNNSKSKGLKRYFTCIFCHNPKPHLKRSSDMRIQRGYRMSEPPPPEKSQIVRLLGITGSDPLKKHKET